ncbi:MAG: SDR family oxidoreductase, partial [Actinobacteria bacterium]|nr:SDR family oxidoreductase [Actinomycetota bacterium]
MEELNLAGKVCLIAGAARGIGEKIAETFNNNGADLAILDINKDRGKELEKRLNRNKNSNKCIFYCCDVTFYNEIKDTCREILDEFGKIDVMVYCIGWSINSPLNEMKVEIWKKAMDINLNGAFYLLHCLINSMLANKRGNIILIGSSTTVTGSGGGVHYSSSKAGLMGLMKGLSYEFLPKGIRANIITPALIDTPLLR